MMRTCPIKRCDPPPNLHFKKSSGWDAEKGPHCASASRGDQRVPAGKRKGGWGTPRWAEYVQHWNVTGTPNRSFGMGSGIHAHRHAKAPASLAHKQMRMGADADRNNKDVQNYKTRGGTPPPRGEGSGMTHFQSILASTCFRQFAPKRD